MQTNEILEQAAKLKRILEHKTETIKQQELLKDLDAQRTDWERRSALFVPSKNRLEKGGRTLELGEAHERIKELRKIRDKNKIRQSSLRDEITSAKTDLHNSEEALNLIEGEYRLKLSEQTKLQNTIQKVNILDKQLKELQESAIQTRKDYNESIKQYKQCSEKVEKEQMALEKIELSLRETRKFLQTHSVDEKLRTTLEGIQKCFVMYRQAEEKKSLLKNSWIKSIEKRQKSQSILNDRSALLSDTIQRFGVLEKNFTRSRAFYESTLKGKSISEWLDICEKSRKKLTELDELYKKFHDVKSLEEQVKNFHELKLKIHQETKALHMRDVEQSSKLLELQDQYAKIEKRYSLLQRIQDLDAVRELLQDNIPCPLCGSITHPYVSGTAIPDPEEIQRQLEETQNALRDLRNEITDRQTRTGKLNDDISAIGQDESELKKQISALNAEITSKVSLLGLKLGTGIPPFDEIDRERQKTRDALQLARIAADTAQSAEKDMRTAEAELENIRETRLEVTRYYQNALLDLQNSKSEEEQSENECKTQDEIINSLKRELISLIMPFGYKTLPDRNPVEVVNSLENRMNEWQKNEKISIELERDLSSANVKLANIKKTRDGLKLKRDDLSNRVKAVEAQRDSVQQQRIVIFESRVPDDEISRMSKDVESLKARLNERREIKNECARKLDKISVELHSVETEMAKGREELQKHEINFNKRLLALGFKNEEDYSAACLTNDERRDLQNKLRILTQEDLDLKSEYENTRAKILELQSDGMNLSDDILVMKLKSLKKSLNDESLQSEQINGLINDIKNLTLKCGLPEVF